jgi:hypothetical protein
VDRNPEAIAWYVEKSEGLLGDLRERVQALRTRGGQLAGFAGAILVLVGANAESILDALHGPARETAGISLLLGRRLTSERFTHEPDLWRVHIRAIHGLLASIESMTRHVDAATQVVEKAEYFFLSGLFTVGTAFATLIAAVTF